MLPGKPVLTIAKYHNFSRMIYFFAKLSEDARMIALLDIGNTHTHIGLADSRRVLRQTDVLTGQWSLGAAQSAAARFLKKTPLAGAILCSVVPAVTPLAAKFLRAEFRADAIELTARTVKGVGIDYPKPCLLYTS